jgi:signal transduction histidine kinase/tetratricopeptide (TPR) repeat protein
MKRLTLILLIVVGVALFVDIQQLRGQLLNTQQLERQLLSMRKNDTAKIGRMLVLADAFLPAQVARAKTLGEEALVLSDKLGSAHHRASSLHLLGRCSVAMNKDADAIEKFRASSALFEEIGDSSKLAGALMDIALAHMRMRAFREALNYCKKSLAIGKALGETVNVLRAHIQLGVIHQNMNSYPSAVAAFTEAVAVAERIQDRNTMKAAFQQMGIIHDISGESAKAIDCFQRSLKIARETGDYKASARALNSLGVVCRNAGEFHKAIEYYRQSLDEQDKLQDKKTVQTDMARTLRNIGDMHMFLGANADALAYYRRSLEMWEAIGSKNGLAEIYGSLGLYFFNISAFDSSLYFDKRALTIDEELGDKDGIGCMLNNIGLVHQMTLSYDSAIVYYTSASEVFEEIGSKLNYANTIQNIGAVNLDFGNTDPAMEYIQRAYAIRKEIGDQNGIAESLGSLGNAYWQKGMYDKALDFYLRSLKQLEENGGIAIAKVLYNIGIVYKETGSYSKAKEYIDRSLVQAERQGDKSQQALSLGGLGDVTLHVSGAHKALEYYERSLRLCETTGEKPGKANALSQMGFAYSKIGQHDKALECLRKSLKLYEEIGAKDIAGTLVYQGEALSKKKNFEAAELYLMRALELAKQNNSKANLSRAFHALSEHYERLGDSTRALGYFKAHAAVKDSFLQQKSLESMNQLTMQYDSEKKLQQINNQQHQLAFQKSEIERKQEQLTIQYLKSLHEKQTHKLELARRTAERDAQRTEKEAKLLKVQSLTKEKEYQASLTSRAQSFNNALLAGFALLLVIGFLGMKRIQDKKRAATLRAEAAEYQARALKAETVAIVSEAERRRKEEMEEFAHRLIKSQEQERARIARELHDSLGQELLVIKNQAHMALHEAGRAEQMAERMQKVKDVALEVLDEMRQLSRNLRPIQLERSGLSNTVREMLRHVEESGAITMETMVEDIDGLFAKDDEINVYRILQESMNNVLKHSEAKCVSVSVRRSNGDVLVSVRDDGRGFQLGSQQSRAAFGMGLQGMQERVQILKGKMSINSSPGTGTRIEVVLPVQELGITN